MIILCEYRGTGDPSPTLHRGNGENFVDCLGSL